MADAGPQAVPEGLEHAVGDVLDVAAAGVQRVDAGGIGVEADDLVAGLGEGH